MLLLGRPRSVSLIRDLARSSLSEFCKAKRKHQEVVDPDDCVSTLPPRNKKHKCDVEHHATFSLTSGPLQQTSDQALMTSDCKKQRCRKGKRKMLVKRDGSASDNVTGFKVGFPLRRVRDLPGGSVYKSFRARDLASNNIVAVTLEELMRSPAARFKSVYELSRRPLYFVRHYFPPWFSFSMLIVHRILNAPRS